MPNIENEVLKNIEKEDFLEDANKETNFNKLVENKTEELNYLANSSKEAEVIFDGAPEEVDLKNIQEAENAELQDWQETAEAIITDNDFEVVKQSWQKEAEQRFGISDFNINTFKRLKFNQDAVSNAFASGKDWEYIINNSENFVSGYSYDEAVKSFEVMQSLEDKKPGCVRELHEKFGITNFQRYPEEILLTQLQDNDNQKEIGLMVFAEADWNGAFDSQSKIWRKIYDNQKERLNFKIIECNSNLALARQLMKLKENANSKVALSFLSAHSDLEEFSLGESGDAVLKEDILKYSTKLKEIFSDKAQLVANACSSASIDGWVQKFSKEIGVSAVGPDRPAAIEDVDFVGNEVVPKYHQDQMGAYTKYHKGFLLSK